jgi:hypothetical protein
MKKLLLATLIGVGLFGFNSIDGKVNTKIQQVQNNSNNYILSGKVRKAYTQTGYGPRGFEWLFMDVETKNGVIKIGIAPTFRISNLPINEGDIVKIDGFTPPYWPKGVIKAWDIYDVTQKKDYPIVGFRKGYGPGWRWR